jgi:hypothetical protein
VAATLFNFDFEFGNQAVGGVGYNEHDAPDHTSIPGWLVVSGGVQRVKNNWPAYSGQFSVALGNSRYDSGSIQQVSPATLGISI